MVCIVFADPSFGPKLVTFMIRNPFHQPFAIHSPDNIITILQGCVEWREGNVGGGSKAEICRWDQFCFRQGCWGSRYMNLNNAQLYPSRTSTLKVGSTRSIPASRKTWPFSVNTRISQVEAFLKIFKMNFHFIWTNKISNKFDMHRIVMTRHNSNYWECRRNEWQLISSEVY